MDRDRWKALTSAGSFRPGRNRRAQVGARGGL